MVGSTAAMAIRQHTLSEVRPTARAALKSEQARSASAWAADVALLSCSSAASCGPRRNSCWLGGGSWTVAVPQRAKCDSPKLKSMLMLWMGLAVAQQGQPDSGPEGRPCTPRLTSTIRKHMR